MKTILAIVLVAVTAGCGRQPAPAASLVKDDAWRKSVDEWRARHEDSYRRNWATIAGLHFLEPGSHSIGSDKSRDIVLPAAVPATVGSVIVDGQSVRYEPAPGVAVSLNGKPAAGAVALKEPGKEATDEVAINDVKFAVHESGKRLSLRVWDPNGKQAREFAGFAWFPVDPDYYVLGRFIRDDKPRNVPVVNTYGDEDLYPTEGVIEFTLNGQTVRLRPFTTDPNRFYIVFRDASSGHETYETARFLYADLKDDGTVALDFNQAYNPPCAFNPYTTCPIPLKENRLAVKILAGEKAYGGQPETEPIP
jgi:uncharacterized protein